MVLGMTLEKDGETHQVPAMVVEMSGDHVTVDYNHPLSGKTLTYKITVEKNEGLQLPVADQGSGGCGCN
jgi:FKBP-type peptidyl-prolyl cis-trans isomerase 2